jgi:hypothetical protein
VALWWRSPLPGVKNVYLLAEPPPSAASWCVICMHEILYSLSVILQSVRWCCIWAKLPRPLLISIVPLHHSHVDCCSRRSLQTTATPLGAASVNLHLFFLLEESKFYFYLAHPAVFRWRTINILNLMSWLPAFQSRGLQRIMALRASMRIFDVRFLIVWLWITWFLGYGI